MNFFRPRSFRRSREREEEPPDERKSTSGETLPAEDDRGFVKRVRIKFRAEWIEILSAAILALATIATAWCAYQSARWSGVMTINFAKSNTARTQSTKAQMAGGQLIQVDVGLFLQYVDAVVSDQPQLADFVESRWFSDELKAATTAWLATDPLNNPDAPKSPFAMAEYTSRNLELSQSYDTLADSYRKDALDSNQRSDNYVLLAVLFASVLFFAGICTKFKMRWIQISLFMLAVIILCVGSGVLFSFPVW
jgi:hypothetical protein